MRDRAVLDSSVIAAVFFRDEASSRAEKAIEDHSPITVEIAMAEVANVAWKRVAFFDEPKSGAFRAMGLSRDFILGVCEVIPSQELLDEAFEIATENRLTIYDSLFVAASEKMKAPLFTTDRKLYERIRGRDDYVVLL
jgi:predicted nucleic acid-binding protein